MYMCVCVCVCVYADFVCASQEMRLVRHLDDAYGYRQKKSKTAYNLAFDDREAYNRVPTPEPGPQLPESYNPAYKRWNEQAFEQVENDTKDSRQRQYDRAEKMAEAVMFEKSTKIPDVCQGTYNAVEDYMAYYDADPVTLSPAICDDTPPKTLYYRCSARDRSRVYRDPRNLGPLSRTEVTVYDHSPPRRLSPPVDSD